ncbi:MAG: DNA modification methylase [Rhodobacteraceae bacterium HLUCCA12]|nr:MAG: DNA modification methylase [Rhodobacteraceae bacterium HLUCCA12]
MMPVEQILPYARNARTHPDWQIDQIAASIAEFGFCNPVLIGDDSVIVAGHGRVLAAKKLGLAEVPVIVLAHLSPAQRRALVIADNRIAENAGWDEEMLRAELAELQDEDFDLDVIGFSETELDELLGDLDTDEALPAELGDPDFVPEAPPRPVSERGDVWLLGPHRVMCGDSTEPKELEVVCNGAVDACWTDPPYNVNYEGAAGKIANDNLAENDFRQFLTRALKAASKVMKPGAPIYVAHAETEGIAFRQAFAAAGFKLSGCLIWVKPSLVLGRSDYQWRHEAILYGWKPGAAHAWYGGRKQTTVREGNVVPLRAMPDGRLQVDVANKTFVVSGQNLSIEAFDGSVIRVDRPKRNAEHPTMKPVALILEMIENSTRRGDTVLDPFGGSGSTLIACHKAGRAARLMELDERYCDVIVNRWQAFSGETARAEADGRSFEEVRTARCVGLG